MRIKTTIDDKQKHYFNKAINDAFLSSKLSIGFFEDKNQQHKNGETSSSIASKHVFGSVVEHLPKRDFMKNVIKDSKIRIVGAFQQAVNNTKIGKNFIYPVLRYTGHNITDRIQAFLNNQGEGKLTPLKESTIKAKGNDKMLEDSKKMKDDLQSKVIKL